MVSQQRRCITHVVGGLVGDRRRRAIPEQMRRQGMPKALQGMAAQRLQQPALRERSPSLAGPENGAERTTGIEVAPVAWTVWRLR